MAKRIGANTVLDESSYNSPNYTPAAAVPSTYGMARKIDSVTIHWWGDPAQKPTLAGISSYLCRAGGNTSAHFGVEAGRANCLVSPANAAWHAGSAKGNATSIGIECNPRMSEGDIQSVVELIQYLETIYGSLKIYGHKDWSLTACPGTYYDKLPEIINRVNGKKSTGSTAAPSPAQGSAMILPVGNARVSQDFGQNGTQFNLATGGHTGRDYAVPTGTSVKAALSGTVVWADWVNNLPGDDSAAGWASRWYLHHSFGGICVVIDHGSFLTVYAHLSETKLNVGNKVSTGQEIGKSGATGAATGPHLHYEVLTKPFAWGNGYYGRVNPTTFASNYNSTHKTTASAVTTEKDWFDMATKADLRAVVEEALAAKRPGLKNRTIVQVLNVLDDHGWNTKKMVRYIFNMYRIGTPGVTTDGRLGGKIRKLLSYNEAEDGKARKAEWAGDAKRNYDF